MDTVRFGRALGFGARSAAKTLITAVDAATSAPAGKTPVATARPVAAKSAAAVRPAVQSTLTRAKEIDQGVRRGGKRFGHSVWNPFVRLSGVLWLEVTGVFFGIFALFAGAGAWKVRGEWHSGGGHFMLAAAMAALFGYFCVSSFVKAHRRERRR